MNDVQNSYKKVQKKFELKAAKPAQTCPNLIHILFLEKGPQQDFMK